MLTIADDLTKVVGRHTVKTGVEVRRDRIALAFINRPNGNFTFNGQYTGNAAADFLLGLPQQYRQASGDPNMDGHTWTTSVYVQDDWRVADGLSVQAGLRYERAAPFVERGDKLNAFHPGRQSTRFPAAPTGLVYPGDPGVPRGTYETDGNNVAPRVGVVWDIGGAGTHGDPRRLGDVLRHAGGAGRLLPERDAGAAVPAADRGDLLALRRRIRTSRIRSPACPPAASGFPPGSIFIGWGPRFTTPLARHAHVSLQRNVGDVVGLEVAYVASRARNLPMFMEVNPTTPVLAPTPRQGPRLLPAFGLVRPSLAVGTVLLRLAAGQRQGPQMARPDGAALVHLGARDRPRVGDQHRRRGAADAAGVARGSRGGRGAVDRRGARPREGRRAVRCAPPHRRSAPTTCCRRSRIAAGSCATPSAAGR